MKIQKKYLKGGQVKLDANKNNKIDAQDFEMLRKKNNATGGMMMKKYEEGGKMSPMLSRKDYLEKIKLKPRKITQAEKDIQEKNYKKGGVVQKKYIMKDGKKMEVSMDDIMLGNKSSEEKSSFIEKYGPGPYTVVTEKQGDKKTKSKTHKLDWMSGVSDAPSFYGGPSEKERKKREDKKSVLGYSEKVSTKKVKDVKRRGEDMIKIVKKIKDDKGKMKRTKEFIKKDSMKAYMQKGGLTFDERTELKQRKTKDRQARAAQRKADRRIARKEYKKYSGMTKVGPGTPGIETSTGYRGGKLGQRVFFGTGRMKRLKEVLQRNKAIKEEIKGRRPKKALSQKKADRQARAEQRKAERAKRGGDLRPLFGAGRMKRLKEVLKRKTK